MNDLNELGKLIWQMPPSHARIPLIEQAVRLADSFGDEEEAYRYRIDLVDECCFYGQFMKAIVAFSWIMSKVKEGVFEFDYEVADYYGAVLSRAAMFDALSLAQLEKLHEDFRVHMEGIGASPHSHHTRILRTGLTLRDEKMASEGRRHMLASKSDQYSDCPACVQNALVQYDLYFSSYDKMMASAKPILEKKMSCNMVPLRTYGHMVNDVYRAGETELAAKICAESIRSMGSQSGFLEQVGLHLIYLSETDMKKATALVKKTIKWSLGDTEAPWGLYFYNIGLYVFFSRFKGRRFLLDAAHPLREEDGNRDFPALAAHHYNLAENLAARFDKRNGHSYCADFLAAESSRVAELKG